MKYPIVFSLLLSFAACFACSSSSPEQISFAKENSPTPVAAPTAAPRVETDSAKSGGDGGSEEDYLPENADIVDRSGEIQMVFMGHLDFKNGGIVSENDWSLGEDIEDKVKPQIGMTFDVMTCAGFVAKAKLKKYHGEKNASDRGYRWEMEFVSGKSAKPDENRFKKCREEAAEAGNGLIRAFAVFPAKTGREKINVKDAPDLGKVFDSISTRDKKWIASDDPENTGYREQKKKNPDIEAWTDADGDGRIDLIEVKGNCNGQPDGDLICRQILYLTNEKWIRVGWLATD